MSRWMIVAKPWLTAAASVFAVVLALGYLISQQTRASAAVRELEELAFSLNKASDQARNGTLAPPQVKELEEQRQDLEKRMEESSKPGMVQAELMASARKAGLDVREVQPTSPNFSGGPSGTKYPTYRVRVQGAYSQVAEYMQLCKAQRVPARPTGFRVTPVLQEDGRRGLGLCAEITMEVFQLRPGDKAPKAEK
jgi:Tfp pilus assembly protein PilO